MLVRLGLACSALARDDNGLSRRLIVLHERAVDALGDGKRVRRLAVAARVPLHSLLRV